MNLAACEVRKVVRLGSSLGLRFWSLHLGENNPTLYKEATQKYSLPQGVPLTGLGDVHHTLFTAFITGYSLQ